MSRRRTVFEERKPFVDSLSKYFLSLASKANSDATKKAVAAIRKPSRISPSDVSIFRLLVEGLLNSSHEL